MSQTNAVEVYLPDPDATTKVARCLAGSLRAGDCFLLSGSIGAGKTHFARALIQEWLRLSDLWDEVPSPTFTLVQTYSNGRDEIWHADLYRLTDPGEVEELGLTAAFDTAIVLIEWPDRLGPDVPDGACRIALLQDGEGRTLKATGPAHLISKMEEALL